MFFEQFLSSTTLFSRLPPSFIALIIPLPLPRTVWFLWIVCRTSLPKETTAFIKNDATGVNTSRKLRHPCNVSNFVKLNLFWKKMSVDSSVRFYKIYRKTLVIHPSVLASSLILSLKKIPQKHPNISMVCQIIVADCSR